MLEFIITGTMKYLQMRHASHNNQDKVQLCLNKGSRFYYCIRFDLLWVYVHIFMKYVMDFMFMGKIISLKALFREYGDMEK